jgi:hypothetical protein
MTYCLLDAMDSTLRRDMCSLRKPGVRIQEATGRVRGSCLLQMVYASEYWVEHLQAGGHACSDMLVNGGKVHRFFQKHLLHWLETMSLLQKVPEAILALQKLEAALTTSRTAYTFPLPRRSSGVPSLAGRCIVEPASLMPQCTHEACTDVTSSRHVAPLWSYPLGKRDDPRVWNPCILRPATSSRPGVYIEHMKTELRNDFQIDEKHTDWLVQRNWPLFNRA